MHVMMTSAQDMTLQGFADPAFSSNLADPVVRRHHGLLSHLLWLSSTAHVRVLLLFIHSIKTFAVQGNSTE